MSCNPTSVCLTSLKDGERYYFGNMSLVCEFLQRSGSYLQYRKNVLHSSFVKNGNTGEEFVMRTLGKGKRRDANPRAEKRCGIAAGTKQQLCEKCAKAAGFCSWSHNLTPVEGWEADPVPDSRGGIYSYQILTCPLFEKDAATPEEARLQRERLYEELDDERKKNA